MLVERGYKNIIEVRIDGFGIEKKYDDSNVNILPIYAREDLGRILEFNPIKARRNINLGYFDTMKAFLEYSGYSYYIDASKNEATYLKQFLMLNKRQVESILMTLGNKGILKQYSSKDRIICEELIPLVAKKMRLSKNASYRDIYFVLLERLAEKVAVEKLKVYTLKSFKEAIHTAIGEMDTASFEDAIESDILIELALALGL
jgi:NTE family protein